MQKVKRELWLPLIVITVFVITFRLFPSFFRDEWNIARTGRSGIEYYNFCMDSYRRTYYAVGVKRSGETVVVGHRDGEEPRVLELQALGISPEAEVLRMYNASRNVLLLLVRDGQNVRMYDINAFGNTSGGLWEQLVRLLSRKDEQEQTAADTLIARLVFSRGFDKDVEVMPSQFVQENDVVGFMLDDGTERTIYTYTLGTDEVEQKEVLTETDREQTVLVLPSGPRILSDGSDMVLYGQKWVKMPEDVQVSMEQVWYNSEGVWLMNEMNGTLWRVRENGSTQAFYPFKQSSEQMSGIRAINADEAYIGFLDEDGVLSRFRNGEIEKIPRIFQRSTIPARLLLGAVALADLLLSVWLWYLLCEFRRMRVTMVLRRGVLAAMVLFLSLCAAENWVIVPFNQHWSVETAHNELRDAALLASASQKLENVDPSFLLDIRRYQQENGVVYLVRDGERWSAFSVLMQDSMVRSSLQDAYTDGEAFFEYIWQGRKCYSFALRVSPNEIVAAACSAEKYNQRAEMYNKVGMAVLWAQFSLSVLLMLVILFQISRTTRRVTQGVDELSAENYAVRLRENHGDEIDALTESVNALAETLGEKDRENRMMIGNYRRFVPDELVRLLGVRSVVDVGLHTYAANRMTVLAVWIKEEGEQNDVPFRRINEVICRTSDFVTRCGGTILNFGDNGFAAIFAPDAPAAVKAAVAIREEVLAFNEEQAAQNAKPVNLRVALDTTRVMVGIVGDQGRMEITSTDASFSRVSSLSRFAASLDAGILCTKAVADHTAEYKSRYVGLTENDGELIRAYEIYGGDAYALRQHKEQSDPLFAEGLYRFYANNYAEAKNIFMELVRRNNEDGAARYYLYLADRRAKEQNA